MFGIGGFELFIILIFCFLIFGPDKLPEIANTVGKGIARFREVQQEVNDTIGTEKIFDPNNPEEPFKDPSIMLDKLVQKQNEKRVEKAVANEDTKSMHALSAKGDSQRDSFSERKARYERERAARKATMTEDQASVEISKNNGNNTEAEMLPVVSDSPDSKSADILSAKTTVANNTVESLHTEGGNA